MKKNKTVAFMLAATLMVGGTFLGTKAWFTAQDTASNDLVITMGSMDVETTDNGWIKLGDSESTPDTGTDFTNVRPGDKFQKTVTVTNKGTLAQELFVSGGAKITTAPDSNYFEIEHTAESLHEKQLGTTEGDKTKTFTITVTVKGSEMGDASTVELSNHGRKFELKNYLSDITIDARQINEVR